MGRARTVNVALDTSVYCDSFMPMDDFHDIEKEVILAVLKY